MKTYEKAALVGLVAIAGGLLIKRGIDTPGGLLGQNSATDFGYQWARIVNAAWAPINQNVAATIAPIGATIAAAQTTAQTVANAPQAVQRGLATPGGLLGKDSATDAGTYISQVQRGLATPGGLLGQNSATDFGYQLKKLFGW